MTETEQTQFEAGVRAVRDGRMAEAVTYLQQVIAGNSDHAPALYNLAAIKYQDGKSDQAEDLLIHALRVRPGHVDTQSLLAAVLADQRKFDAAVPLTRTILENNAADAGALNTAGRILAVAGWPDDAEAAFRSALKKEPAYRLAVLGLVNLLLARRIFEQAAQVCDQYLKHRPLDQDVHLKRAQAMWEGGQTASARNALQDLLDFAPDHITAHYNLSLFANPPDAKTSIARLTVLLSEGDLDDEDRIKAWFTLGNLFATQDDHEASMACFTRGNAERARLATSAHGLSTEGFDQRVKTILSLPQPEVQGGPMDRPTPLIITGPSRSGKSILQSWLAGHPDIAAADETGILPNLAQSEVMTDPARRSEAAATYRAALKRLGGPARYVIDTHPVNSLYLDLLPQLCPDAKIIQIGRDPLDLAVSIFMRHFVTGGHWADSWSGIASRLKSYEVLQNHWSDWTPVVATVAYEDLVANSSSVLQSLVTKLDLPWTVEVNPPFSSETGSKIHAMPWASFNDRPAPRSDMMGLWKPFAPWLAEFADAYGRDAIQDNNLIPISPHAPVCDLMLGLDSLAASPAEEISFPAAIEDLPAVHTRKAYAAQQNGHFKDAIQHRWQALSHRPFTHHVRRHADALEEALKNSKEHEQLAALHKDVNTYWQAYRKNTRLPFGDFGLPYQSCSPVLIPGSRDTDVQFETYGLESLSAGARVLDLGSNLGFLALTCAGHAKQVAGIEKDPTLVAIAHRVRTHLNIKNSAFEAGDVMAYETEHTFDLVIAAALHGWIEAPLSELTSRIARLTSPRGAVLFESQGRRSTTEIEDGFADKVAALMGAGFTVERDGQICDDRVNLRAFVILRRAV